MPARKVRVAGRSARRLELVYVPVDELRLWKKNPRENDEAAEALCMLLDSYGFINPIIATRDKIVRAGNTRLKSARLSGISEVPVIYVDFESETEAELFSIADNKSHEFSRWNKELLASLFSQARGASMKRKELVQGTGFSPVEIERLRILTDDAERDLHEFGPLDSERRLRSLFNYPGGKGRDAAWILSFMPPHKAYVEVFLGAASVFFAKEPVPIEVLNDIDGDLVNFYRVLRSKKFFPKLLELCELTLQSRKEWKHARSFLNGGKGDKLHRAWAYFVMVAQSFGGDAGSWGYSLTGSGGGARRWLRNTGRLDAAHARFRGAQIECIDFRKCIQKYDQPGTLLYLDPPYVHETRTAVEYRHEISDEDHKELIEILLSYPEAVMLSGYEHPIYTPLEKNRWMLKKRTRVSTQRGATRAGKSRGMLARFSQVVRTECLWINPVCQERLAKHVKNLRRSARRVRR